MQIGVLVIFLTCGLVSGQEEDSKLCSGKFQNPINANDLRVELKEFPQIHYLNFHSTPEAMQMSNNGHSLVVTMNTTILREPRIRGGPLESNATYEFEQIYFHWGATDIAQDPFPMELHLLLRNTENKNHGIAVLAFSLTTTRIYHPLIEEIVQKLPNISRKGLSADLEKPFSLRSILPKNLVNYYSYTGTLATPPCAEKVIWIDYWEPIYISKRQINSFRQFTASDDHLKKNYRLSHLFNRIVYENMPPIPDALRDSYSNVPFTNVPNKCSIICRCQAFLLAVVVIKALINFLKY